MEPENLMATTNNETRQEHDGYSFNNAAATDGNLQEKNKVRKRLDFGIDEKLTEAYVNDLLKNDLREQRQKAIEKWNFDFENEVPLEGQWIWEKVPVQPKSNKEIVSNEVQKDDDNRAV